MTRCFVARPAPVAPDGSTPCYLWLRRYTSGTPCPRRPGQYSYHDNWTPLGILESGFRKVLWSERFPDNTDSSDSGRWVLTQNFVSIGRDDPHWPKSCACGYEFCSEDNWQNFTERMYVADDGRKWPQRELPPGAMWYEDWLPRNFYWDNKTDAHLMVMLPNSTEWNIDSRANNCTLPNDRNHRCWTRTGEPPNVTAGKNGNTCAAGAGSILSGSYHGFLTNGELT